MLLKSLFVLGCVLGGFLSTSVAFAQQSDKIAAARAELEEYRKSKAPIWMNDFAELGRYHDANAALPAPAAGENRVVFMGDSITDGWHLTESFPGK
jgi:hypothetical protein